MKLMPLKKVASISMGTAPPGSTYNMEGNGLPMIAGAGDFTNLYPAPKKWTTAPTRIANKGDLILCVRATIGDQNWADKSYCLGRGVAGLRSIEGQSNIRYLARALQAFEKELSSLARGANFKALRKTDLENFEIPLPPLDEQKRIAAVLDKADALLRLRQQSLDLTEKLIQSVFLDMFGDPVTNPKGWSPSNLDSLCERIVDCPHSTPKYSDHQTPFFCVRSSDIQNGKLDLKSTRFVSEETYLERIIRHKPQEYDVVFTREGGRLGQAALIPPNRNICLGQRMMLFIPKHGTANGFFLTCLLNSKQIQQKIRSLIGGGAAPRVNIKDLKSLIVYQPPFQLQQDFEEILRIVERQTSYAAGSNLENSNLFSSLQQRAFRGDLDLSNLILEEEAEEIIEAADKLNKLVHDTLPRTLGSGISLRALKPSATTEKKLKAQDKAIEADDQIPWSPDYFKFRLLAKQPAEISIADLMSQAESIFTGPSYDAIRDILFDYLDPAQGKPVLTQTFDKKRKEIILQPA